MNMLWLLGGLGIGAGLMALADPEQGAERREVIREHMRDYGRQTGDFVDHTRRTLGRQTQAMLDTARRPLQHQPGLGERLYTQVEEKGMSLGLALLGGIGLAAGLAYLLEPEKGPQRRARLRQKARAYWRRTEDGTAPALRRAWRFFQGRETHRVDPHTRKPAQAEAWYAEPVGYDSPVLYSEPFLTRDEAEAWASNQDALYKPWRVFQGRETHRVDPHTRKPAQAEAWYVEPGDYDSPVLYSEPFLTRAEAEAWASTQHTP